MDKLETAIAHKRIGKPKVTIGVNVDTGGLTPGDSSWRKDEVKRLEAEVKALQDELTNFNAKEAAEKVRKGLQFRIRAKRLRLDECKLKLDTGYGYLDYKP